MRILTKWYYVALMVGTVLPWSGYCKIGGGRDPIISVGAPGNVEIFIPTDEPVLGTPWVENGISTAVNADRSDVISSFRGSGKCSPNSRALEFSDPGATCHPASVRILDICIARKSASASPFVNLRFTRPGFAANDSLSFITFSGGMTRQATTCFICSVCNLATAASRSSSAARTRAFPATLPASMPSFFASATLPSTESLYFSSSLFASVVSCLCRTTTDAVVTKTAIARAPAPSNDSNISCSQPCRSSPSIRLTFLEKAVLSVWVVAGICFVVCIAWVMVSFRRIK